MSDATQNQGMEPVIGAHLPDSALDPAPEGWEDYELVNAAQHAADPATETPTLTDTKAIEDQVVAEVLYWDTENIESQVRELIALALHLERGEL